MASEYRHNHYVPVWYQKRFLPPGQADRELQYWTSNRASLSTAEGCVTRASATLRSEACPPRQCFLRG